MTPINTQPKPCYFFTIPIELRLIVYEEMLSAFTISESSNLALTPSGQYLCPLLNTCTQIRAEAAKPYHRRLHEILDDARGAVRSALDEIVEWEKRPIRGGFWHMQQEYRMEAARKSTIEWYRRITPVVNGEMVMARGEMEGEVRGTVGELGARDVFGDWYVVSAVRETDGRGKR